MNTREKKEALVQAVEEIAGKEAAYWEGNPKMQETFQNCYVSTAKTTTKFLESGEAYVFTGDIAAMWLRFFCTGRSLSAISEKNIQS